MSKDHDKQQQGRNQQNAQPPKAGQQEQADTQADTNEAERRVVKGEHRPQQGSQNPTRQR